MLTNYFYERFPYNATLKEIVNSENGKRCLLKQVEAVFTLMIFLKNEMRFRVDSLNIVGNLWVIAYVSGLGTCTKTVMKVKNTKNTF